MAFIIQWNTTMYGHGVELHTLNDRSKMYICYTAAKDPQNFPNWWIVGRFRFKNEVRLLSLILQYRTWSTALIKKHVLLSSFATI